MKPWPTASRGHASWTALAVGGALVLGVLPSQAVCRSELALARVRGERHPELILAQRTIEREWGPSEDSVYVETDIPGWRSDGLALGLSAAVPGLGQAYVGERRGLWFALAEAIGWTAHVLYRHRGNELRDQAAHYVGAPSDSTSAWSFARWAHATQGDPSSLEALFSGDREAFYDLIASDPGLLDGWAGDPAATRTQFAELLRHSDERLRFSRGADVILMMNHIAAALDALRLARDHDLPLRRNLDLRIKSGWQGGGPMLIARLETRF